MSRRNSKVVEQRFTDFSSGDCNMTKHCQEENNNDIEQLSNDLNMGCIVDAIKRPPNICIETFVHDEEKSDDDNPTVVNNEAEGYSEEEFEEDKTDAEEEEEKREERREEDTREVRREGEESPAGVTLSKSQSSTSANRPRGSVSAASIGYGSISIPPTRRINMSFTNERLREIERHNHILLSKIVRARNTPVQPAPGQVPVPRPPNAAVHRRAQQRKIDHENMILLKKIQRAKSSACSTRH